MLFRHLETRIHKVAPLAGSVDRNSVKELKALYKKMSLPSRGAWIEMATEHGYILGLAVVAPLAGSVDRNLGNLVGAATANRVAPLAGSVDRNEMGCGKTLTAIGRSPRGERG